MNDRPVGRALRLALAALAALGLGGCATAGFYLQAVQGHLGVMARARPIEAVVANPDTPADLKERLALVLRIREFASRELALPDNGSYRAYADLGRPAVVWNLFAASEFSVEARQWCFPVAGCVGYRGYFDRGAAERFAEGLRLREGLQTWVGPVPAYSTLGWFDDPVLNTFVRWPKAELARLLFHELAHQRVHLRGDTAFNESYAVAVELEGVRRWMDAQGDPAAGEAYARSLARREALFAMLLAHRSRLAALFREPIDDAAMRARRQALDTQLREAYAAFRVQWGQPAVSDRAAVPFDGFDRWFGDVPNNAQLASVALYNEHVPAFQRLLAESAGDLARFHARVEALARLPKAERLRVLAGGAR
jgi:predicted aminopeptidase